MRLIDADKLIEYLHTLPQDMGGYALISEEDIDLYAEANEIEPKQRTQYLIREK